MNKQRRKKLDAIWSQLEELIEEEQDSFDNRPDSLQDSAINDAMSEAIDSLTEAKDLLRGVIDGG